MDTTVARKKLKISENGAIDAPKKNQNEKELESFLFGDIDDKIWDRTGHELSDQESEEEQSASGAEAEEPEEAFFFDSGPGFVMDSEPASAVATEAASVADGVDSNEVDHPMIDGHSEIDYEDEEDEDDEESEPEERNYGYLRKPAWEDDDDSRLLVSLKETSRLKKLRKEEEEDVVDGYEYERRLRAFHNKMHPRPTWAKLPSEKKYEKHQESGTDPDGDDLDDEDRLELLKSTYGILDLQRDRGLLKDEYLNIRRVKNANIQAQSKEKINTLDFHPNAQVMLAGGEDKTLRLFQIDGRVNPKIQSVFFKDLKVSCAKFHPSGNQVIVSGRQKFYYIYDVQSGTVDRCKSIWGRDEKSLPSFTMSPCGKYIAFRGQDGHIILVSSLTKQWIGDLKMNKSIEGMSWSSDGKFLQSIAHDGEVYLWDVGQRECVKRWTDDGAVYSTAFASSPNDKYYATGSRSGIVNLYDERVLEPNNTRPTPLKIVQNLTTQIETIRFNHDSQLMAIASHAKKDALKMVHLPSGTVYKNWPNERTALGRVTTVEFSRNSDYFAVANDIGRVTLYALNHYAL